MSTLILAIETSCDETAAAVFSLEKGIISSVLYSQTDEHCKHGGVIPEVASRSHLEKIDGITQSALKQASVSLNDIQVIAVTNKPGLPGSLLIGVCFAKGMGWADGKKIVGINHLEGHAFSSFIEHEVPFPHLCITASGGHTSLYLVEDFGRYIILGQTLDDAAGEAFDKIAKIMGLAYPGGPIIERLAKTVHFNDFFHYPRGSNQTLDFSFSGLKTAVLYDLVKKGWYDLTAKKPTEFLTEEKKAEVASSLLVAIKDIFEQKLALALEKNPAIKAVTFVGGVACNSFIRQQLREFCEQRGLTFFVPSPKYCTDNAAMIAFVASYKVKQGIFDDYASLDILK